MEGLSEMWEVAVHFAVPKKLAWPQVCVLMEWTPTKSAVRASESR